MSIADVFFKDDLREILHYGTSDDIPGYQIRAKWPDGTPAHTLMAYHVINRYDLREEFPILTLRKQNFKAAVDEILWIYQKKSNNVHDLNSHVWDAWADEDGSIGKTYGYQIGVKSKYPDGEYDQMDRVLKDLKENPLSRRILTTCYNPHDLHEMNLYPCVWSMTFNVDMKTGTLHMLLNQRSQDMITANGWDVMAHAALLMMIAQATGYQPGILTHVIANAHIYDRHIPIARELIKRTPYRAPKVQLDPDIKDFYAFTPDSFELTDYEYGPSVGKLEVAI